MSAKTISDKKLSRYLDTATWRARRERYRQSVGSRCESCDARRPLMVYHVSHDRLNGRERNDDLVCLCPLCHSREHPGKTVHCGPFAYRYDPDSPFGDEPIPHPQEAKR